MGKTAATRVLSVDGMQLMPTRRPRHVRNLLEEGKAKIVCHRPFTIQLLYESKTFVQDIEKCVDTGYQYIGTSLKSETAEYDSKEIKLLGDEKQKHDDQRMHRRTRRNRKRYRKPRFDNRRKPEGWLPPSTQHKFDQHLREIEKDIETTPVTDVYIEVGEFDPALLKAIEKGEPVPEGEDYQHGDLYRQYSLRAAVFSRDRHRCTVCGRGVEDGAILHAHHALYWQGRHGNSLDELLTVCEKCHTTANHQKGGKLWGLKPKAARLEDTTFMNVLRWKLYNTLRDKYPEIRIHLTYGAHTKLSRNMLELEKSHANDAYAMGRFHPSERADTVYTKKIRRNNRILEKFYDAKYTDKRDGKEKTGKELGCERTNRREPRTGDKNLRFFRLKKTQKGRRVIRTEHYPIRPGDTILFDRNKYISKGCHCNGKRVMLDNGKSVAVSNINVLKYAAGWMYFDVIYRKESRLLP